MKILPRSFYARGTAAVARELLGKYLIRRYRGKKLIGRIVETEAYLENDPASHAFRRTPRSEPMFGDPGHAYVYFIYGNHYRLNFVTERSGKAGAVLIRALEPINPDTKVSVKKNGNRDLSRGMSMTGPGRLTKALKIDKRFNRADLTKGDLVVAKGKDVKFAVVRSKRIGISKASSRLLRFNIKGNPFVS